MTCYIVAAMPTCVEIAPQEDDFVIAVDGGFAQLKGLRADAVLGDFDSLGYTPHGDNVLTYAKEKDDTDTMLAVKLGMEKGYRHFVIVGGIGGRFCHTFANIQTLAYIVERGGSATLVGDDTRMTVIKNDTLHLPQKAEGIVSVFAYSGAAQGVSINGLKYEVQNAQLVPDLPLGVSNEFCGKPAVIEVKHGMLLIVVSFAPQDNQG